MIDGAGVGVTAAIVEGNRGAGKEGVAGHPPDIVSHEDQLKSRSHLVPRQARTTLNLFSERTGGSAPTKPVSSMVSRRSLFPTFPMSPSLTFEML